MTWSLPLPCHKLSHFLRPPPLGAWHTLWTSPQCQIHLQSWLINPLVPEFFCNFFLSHFWNARHESFMVIFPIFCSFRSDIEEPMRIHHEVSLHQPVSSIGNWDTSDSTELYKPDIGGFLKYSRRNCDQIANRVSQNSFKTWKIIIVKQVNWVCKYCY